MILKAISDIEKILLDNYNVIAVIKQLAGEADYNYKVISDTTTYLLKICKSDVLEEEVQFQVALLAHLNNKDLSFEVPMIINTSNGEKYILKIINDEKYIVRLHSWVSGVMLDEIIPRTKDLFISWGVTCGELSNSLSSFDHSGAHRFDKWNPIESLHSKKYIEYIENEAQKGLAIYFWNVFEEIVIPAIDDLRSSVNYSDAHEQNLLLKDDYRRISGVIDFGDAIYAPTICELAIACAYAGMYAEDPIEVISYVVKGYHSQYSLKENEVEILLPLIFGRLMITVANAAYNIKQEPENKYLQVSAKPAWDLLEKLRNVNLNFAHYYFRASCGWVAHPKRTSWNQWLKTNFDHLISPINLSKHISMDLDLSVGSLDLGNNSNFENITKFERKINQILDDKNATLGIGGYKEVRPFYTTDAYKTEGNNGPRWRTMHLGTDYWTQAGEPVYSIADGIIHSIKNNDADCDYGPTIIIKHKMDDEDEYFTLYGHLSLSSLIIVAVGDEVKAGSKIAEIGAGSINGGWPPHLHFQVILDLLDSIGDFPGVCYVSESKIWTNICPRISIEKSIENASKELVNRLISDRKKILGKSLSVSYEEPLHIVRGYKQYLYDINGRRYLDMVNNVAHVGHEHPRVVKAATSQMGLLNTNTRYINENITKYAELLLSKCPEGLEVVYFVNSGSEANELALRMAKVYTSEKDIIALEAGYHGNTGATVDVSSYKFDGIGGQGAPEHTSIIPMPDLYRGSQKDNLGASEYYSRFIQEAIAELKSKDRNVAGFIAESILSCGGQIVLPDNYLKEAYEIIRAEGGLCIADEVQVGFGRVGSYYWGFELQKVVPDIITCGKPIGNGHPLGAVITTKKVADTFANGMEYFNTYGGNPVSCAVGYEVLTVIDDEKLQENAHLVGNHLLKRLEDLKSKHDLIGDVRGVGLFCGIELVRSRETLEPADNEATYIVNRLKEQGILLSTDGPLHNVIKMKPPMCFTINNVEEMIMRLDQVIYEIDSIKQVQKWN
ncbi:MAG: 4-aminobutyrate aminotransferase-like enzyme/Ser/Thr protein kinase RdoA (MazF antagonist) [Saprospiraceae bacterium]|jgi:4-aminobutyrate aminotransferase-like enzyme/Ser/Thr protein kinase RdoA (MazF antagonist)